MRTNAGNCLLWNDLPLCESDDGGLAGGASPFVAPGLERTAFVAALAHWMRRTQTGYPEIVPIGESREQKGWATRGHTPFRR